MSGKELTGQVQLELINAATNQSVDGWFQNVFPNQYFTVAAGQSEAVKFPIEVPFLFNQALSWRVTARAGNFTDAEESSLPVLTNKLLVTETLPLPMRGATAKNFTFDKLLGAKSETLQHHGLTVEYTSNPAWYAVQALPYLIDHPHESAEQHWNRYYANALGTMLVNASPRIRKVFEQWKTADTAALLSKLQKNEELKSLLLQETPWVMQAKTEEGQKKNIALLLDLVRMSNALTASLDQLRSMQSENGGFVWFKGGPDDRYITQYVVTGIGHLKKLNAVPKDQQPHLDAIAQAAIAYLDKKLKEDYDKLLKGKVDLKKQHASAIQIQYLYMRSFFQGQPVPSGTQAAYQFFRKQAQLFWMKQNKQAQGMAALALYRTGDNNTSKAILASLRETAISSEELGMYWKDNTFGFSWYW